MPTIPSAEVNEYITSVFHSLPCYSGTVWNPWLGLFGGHHTSACTFGAERELTLIYSKRMRHSQRPRLLLQTPVAGLLLTRVERDMDG